MKIIINNSKNSSGQLALQILLYSALAMIFLSGFLVWANAVSDYVIRYSDRFRALEIAEAIHNKKAALSACYQIADYLRDYQHNYDIALLYYRKILEICTSMTGLFIAAMASPIATEVWVYPPGFKMIPSQLKPNR